MKTTTPKAAIRLSITPEVQRALSRAKQLYPTLSDPEILKLGLSNIVREKSDAEYTREQKEIMAAAAYSVGYEYLGDPEEDIYTLDMGEKVHF